MKPKCSVPGCNKNAMSKGRTASGKQRFSKFCNHHLRGPGNHYSRVKARRLADPNYKEAKPNWKVGMAFQPCTLCGWNESFCDVHRIVPGSQGGLYEPANCIALCPNCHRKFHYGKSTTGPASYI